MWFRGLQPKSRKYLFLVLLIFIIICFLTGFNNKAVSDSSISIPIYPPQYAANIAWMLVATALVMIMTMPGLALYFGGFSKKAAQLNTMSMVFVSYAVVTVIWVTYGFSLAFSPTVHGVIGDGSHFFLAGFAPDSVQSKDIQMPVYLYVAYQMSFAAITVALVSGGLIERTKFAAWLGFIVLWVTAVYAPIAHWVWADGGFLKEMGVLDYAGGTVVHLNAGIATLVGTLIVGKRTDRHENPRNLPFVMIGTCLLWFGFMGFNGGAAGGANAKAATALLNTNISAAAASITWMLMQTFHTGKPTLAGLCDGAIAGLVGITPAGGYVNPMGATVIGLVEGILPYGAVIFKTSFDLYDDTFNNFALHCISGSIGALLTGIYADPSICHHGDDIGGAKEHCHSGLLFGNPKQFGLQLAGVCICLAYSAAMTAVILIALKKAIGLRVKIEKEKQGIDKVEHGEFAYIEFKENDDHLNITVVEKLPSVLLNKTYDDED
jgi:ammonium transporter, Amt family